MEHSLKSKMIPAKEAAAIVKYSADYVATLARTNQIVGRQEGRQWCVDLDSLKTFELRKVAERKERQREMKKQSLAKFAEAQMAHLDDHHKNSQARDARIAFGAAATLSVCLFLFGFITFVAQEQDVSLAAFTEGTSEIANSWWAFWTLWGIEEPEIDPVAEVVSVPEKESTAPAIVVTDQFYSPEEVAEIVHSFSDPVNIQYVSEHAGVVTPEFADATSTDSYQFILIPGLETEP